MSGSRTRARLLGIALAVASAAYGGGSPARGDADGAVTLVVHVPLVVPDLASAPRDAQCDGDRRTYPTAPLPAALMRRYERALHALGPIDDRYGIGTWTVPGTHGSSTLRFEEDDHVFVRTHARALVRALPALLRRMRAELHQQEMLAEIVGASDTTLGERATRISVTLARGEATYATVATLHRIFADAGAGGASQFDAPGGVDIYSDVAPPDVDRIAANVRRAGFSYATEPMRIVEVDAPRCAAR